MKFSNPRDQVVEAEVQKKKLDKEVGNESNESDMLEDQGGSDTRSGSSVLGHFVEAGVPVGPPDIGVHWIDRAPVEIAAGRKCSACHRQLSATMAIQCGDCREMFCDGIYCSFGSYCRACIDRCYSPVPSEADVSHDAHARDKDEFEMDLEISELGEPSGADIAPPGTTADMSSTFEDSGGSIAVVGSEVEFRNRAVETEIPEKHCLAHTSKAPRGMGAHRAVVTSMRCGGDNSANVQPWQAGHTRVSVGDLGDKDGHELDTMVVEDARSQWETSSEYKAENIWVKEPLFYSEPEAREGSTLASLARRMWMST